MEIRSWVEHGSMIRGGRRHDTEPLGASGVRKPVRRLGEALGPELSAHAGPEGHEEPLGGSGLVAVAFQDFLSEREISWPAGPVRVAIRRCGGGRWADS